MAIEATKKQEGRVFPKPRWQVQEEERKKWIQENVHEAEPVPVEKPYIIDSKGNRKQVEK